jgi:hypothetical protein
VRLISHVDVGEENGCFGLGAVVIGWTAYAFVSDGAGNLFFRVRLTTRPPSPKNKVGKSGIFLAATQRRFSRHVLPAIHHVLTIKKPRSTTCFFQNPPQKHQQKRESHAVPSAEFFSKNEAKHSA